MYNFFKNKKTILDNIKNYYKKITNFFIGSEFKKVVLIAIITATLTSYLQVCFQGINDRNRFNENVRKVHQITNAEIFEYLTKIDKYVEAKNDIAYDVEFVSFLLDTRFNIEPLASILSNNFQYLSESDVYYLAILRDKLVSINHRLDLLALRFNEPRISDSRFSCRFTYFLPEDKKIAHQVLNDDFNRAINSIGHLSFFSGNTFPQLNEYFNLSDVQVSVFHFFYSPDYDKIPSCE